MKDWPLLLSGLTIKASTAKEYNTFEEAMQLRVHTTAVENWTLIDFA